MYRVHSAYERACVASDRGVRQVSVFSSTLHFRVVKCRTDTGLEQQTLLRVQASDSEIVWIAACLSALSTAQVRKGLVVRGRSRAILTLLVSVSHPVVRNLRVNVTYVGHVAGSAIVYSSLPCASIGPHWAFLN